MAIMIIPVVTPLKTTDVTVYIHIVIINNSLYLNYYGIFYSLLRHELLNIDIA